MPHKTLQMFALKKTKKKHVSVGSLASYFIRAFKLIESERANVYGFIRAKVFV